MKLVILDRDGVINLDSDQYIKSVAEWIPIEGSIEAIARLSLTGFTIVVATNQSGLGRGLFDLDDLEAMHAKLDDLVEAAGGSITGIFYCPHAPEDDCDCRKPKSGLIDAIEAELHCSAMGVPIVGDSLRDLECGISKGCVPILVTTGKGEKTLSQLSQHPIKGLQVFADLSEAATYIIENF